MLEKMHIGDGKRQRISDVNGPRAFKILRALPDTFWGKNFAEAAKMAPSTVKIYLRWLTDKKKIQKSPSGRYRKINITTGTRYGEPVKGQLL